MRWHCTALCWHGSASEYRSGTAHSTYLLWFVLWTKALSLYPAALNPCGKLVRIFRLWLLLQIRIFARQGGASCCAHTWTESDNQFQSPLVVGWGAGKIEKNNNKLRADGLWAVVTASLARNCGAPYYSYKRTILAAQMALESTPLEITVVIILIALAIANRQDSVHSRLDEVAFCQLVTHSWNMSLHLSHTSQSEEALQSEAASMRTNQYQKPKGRRNIDSRHSSRREQRFCDQLRPTPAKTWRMGKTAHSLEELIESFLLRVVLIDNTATGVGLVVLPITSFYKTYVVHHWLDCLRKYPMHTSQLCSRRLYVQYTGDTRNLVRIMARTWEMVQST